MTKKERFCGARGCRRKFGIAHEEHKHGYHIGRFTCNETSTIYRKQEKNYATHSASKT